MMIRNRVGRILRAFSGALLLSLLFSCTTDEDLPPIHEHVSSPMAVAKSSDQQYFYVLNGDFNRRYESGSVLMFRRDGSEKKGLVIPHYGRALKVAGDRMLVAYDKNPEEDGVTWVDLYQVSNAAEMTLPVLKKRWEFEDCRALNVTMRQDYDYFGVACENGDLLLGVFDGQDLSRSSLKKARSIPGFVRRAMHMDTQRNILYGFVTDMNRVNSRDKVEKDVSHYDADQAIMVDGANDVPDSLEKERNTRQRLRDSGSSYQFMVLDLSAAKNKSADGREFVFRDFSETRLEEFRFLYWTDEGDEDEKKHFEDSVKAAEEVSEPDNLEERKTKYKYYRTNFWDAYPDPTSTDDKSFFLSHRGDGASDNSPHANAIIRVTLKDGKEGQIMNMSELTGSVFSFKKVYGRKSHRIIKTPAQGSDPDIYYRDYFGSIDFTKAGADSVMLVNSFRSSDLFEKESSYSLRAVKGEGETFESDNKAVIHSEKTTLNVPGYLFEFAASAEIQGNAATGDTLVLATSFFNDSVILLKLEDSQFTELQRFQ